jgi:RNA polymerase-binding transcription factor DksA
MTSARDAVRRLLTDRHTELAERFSRLQGDRMRAEGPLDPDFEEQAVETQNDETLDRLAAAAEAELAQVERALARLDAGKYGICEQCGIDIEPARLRAAPQATLCATCAGALPRS